MGSTLGVEYGIQFKDPVHSDGEWHDFSAERFTDRGEADEAATALAARRSRTYETRVIEVERRVA